MQRLLLKMGLRKSVTFFSVCLTAAIVICISILSYYAARRTIEKNTETLVFGLMEETTKRLDEFVGSVKRMT